MRSLEPATISSKCMVGAGGILTEYLMIQCKSENMCTGGTKNGGTPFISLTTNHESLANPLRTASSLEDHSDLVPGGLRCRLNK